MEACSKCGSRSGPHTDPDKDWCFACHTKSGKGKSLIDIKRNCLEMPETEGCTSLCIKTHNCHKTAMHWLQKYYLGSLSSIRIWGIFWSHRYNRLCFPYYQQLHLTEDKKMLGCWMRKIEDEGRETPGPKWIFAGQKDFCWLIKATDIDPVFEDTVCLVEDIVSAIRVSKYMDCVCLGGTSINTYVKDRIEKYKTVYLFLDGDVAGVKGAEKIRRDLKLGHVVRVIRAKKDPKEFDDFWLGNILNG